mgnify:CR=1 FL=1
MTYFPLRQITCFFIPLVAPCKPLLARADREIALYVTAGGAEKARIPAGTLMHVFHQDEDWLHVIIPDREINWQTNWNRTYGFVRRDDVTVGQTLTDLKWK